MAGVWKGGIGKSALGKVVWGLPGKTVGHPWDTCHQIARTLLDNW